MCALNPVFNLFGTAHVPVGPKARKCGTAQDWQRVEDPRVREKTQNRGNELKGVLENKGHHFFE